MEDGNETDMSMYGSVIFRTRIRQTKWMANWIAMVARMSHEKRLVVGRWDESCGSGLLAEMKKKSAAMKSPEIVIWLP